MPGRCAAMRAAHPRFLPIRFFSVLSVSKVFGLFARGWNHAFGRLLFAFEQKSIEQKTIEHKLTWMHRLIKTPRRCSTAVTEIIELLIIASFLDISPSRFAVRVISGSIS